MEELSAATMTRRSRSQTSSHDLDERRWSPAFPVWLLSSPSSCELLLGDLTALPLHRDLDPALGRGDEPRSIAARSRRFLSRAVVLAAIQTWPTSSAILRTRSRSKSLSCRVNCSRRLSASRRTFVAVVSASFHRRSSSPATSRFVASTTSYLRARALPRTRHAQSAVSSVPPRAPAPVASYPMRRAPPPRQRARRRSRTVARPSPRSAFRRAPDKTGSSRARSTATCRRTARSVARRRSTRQSSVDRIDRSRQALAGAPHPRAPAPVHSCPLWSSWPSAVSESVRNVPDRGSIGGEAGIGQARQLPPGRSASSTTGARQPSRHPQGRREPPVARWRSARGTRSSTALNARTVSALTVSTMRLPFVVSRMSAWRPSSESLLRETRPSRARPSGFGSRSKGRCRASAPGPRSIRRHGLR